MLNNRRKERVVGAHISGHVELAQIAVGVIRRQLRLTLLLYSGIRRNHE